MLDLNDGVTYLSFCLESENHFTPGDTYSVESVGGVATGGGGNDGYAASLNGVTGNPVSLRTKWLYVAFMSGDLTESAKTVQEAIWWLEDECDGVKKSWTDSLRGKWQSDKEAYKAGTSDYSNWTIVAVNLTNNNGDDIQSQLVGIAAPVPEPATMVLFGIGLAGLAGLKRRKK